MEQEKATGLFLLIYFKSRDNRVATVLQSSRCGVQ